MAGRGPKPLSNAEKALRGTIRSSRAAIQIDLPPAEGTPRKPTWLTEAGELVWDETIEHLIAMRTIGAVDADAFGLYCNLTAKIAAVWAEGGIPPVTFISELRKISEQFGAFGARSRLMKMPTPEAKTPTTSAFTQPKIGAR